MIQIAYGTGFLKSVQAMPVTQQRKLAQMLVHCSKNPFHPLLHTKRLTGALTGFLSFRITRDWRVIFKFIDAQTIQLIEAAHRKNIYR